MIDTEFHFLVVHDILFYFKKYCHHYKLLSFNKSKNYCKFEIFVREHMYVVGKSYVSDNRWEIPNFLKYITLFLKTKFIIL